MSLLLLGFIFGMFFGIYLENKDNKERSDKNAKR